MVQTIRPLRNVVNWTAMLCGYLRYRFEDEALRLFLGFLESGIMANAKMLVCLIGCVNVMFFVGLRRMLGHDYKSKRGYIGLKYYGRIVSIKILPVGIHMVQIESVKSIAQTAKKVEELKKICQGKTVILGVDDIDVFKGISLKFLAMEQLLEDCPNLRGSVVLVHIMNPTRSRGQNIQEVKNERQKVANEVNERFSQDSYEPIVFVNGLVLTQDKVAYYAISECVMVNAVRDGMNLVPYKQGFKNRECSPELDKALAVGESKDRKSVIIVLEFIGCSPFLSGTIRVNPWNIESVTEAMRSAIMMPDNEKKLRNEKHYNYSLKHGREEKDGNVNAATNRGLGVANALARARWPGVAPRRAMFRQSFTVATDPKHTYFKQRQESARKDVERAFGVLQGRWGLIQQPARAYEVNTLRRIMYAGIIMHNMILEDQK
ncbi:probable alpha,alpha-trehalose-phosphate synthase [UDP-forming] 11 [Tanacetum coccineum]